MSPATKSDDVASRGNLRVSRAGKVSQVCFWNSAALVGFVTVPTDAGDANEDMLVLLPYARCLDALDPPTSSSIGNFRSPSLWNAVSEMKVGTTTA